MEARAQGLVAGRYRKIEPIGIGGMALVFLAEDERLGRRVAIKQLHAESPAEAAERFEREAKLGASLNHPNLVSIYDIASDAESVLIVMEYVQGETLQEAIAAGPLSVSRVVSIVHDVAAALGHAHAQGIVHRDVKPANILLRDDGVTKLADLGIATAAERTSITRSGMVLGTASYMAPEQLDGKKAGPAADVYALAAVAFEALSGRKALVGETPMEIAHRVVSEPAPDLREAWPEAPAAAAEALRRGMARRPEDRPSSVGELAAALQRGLRGANVASEARTAAGEDRERPAPLPPLVHTPPTASRPTYRRGRSAPAWLPVAAGAAVLLALAVAALALLGSGGGGGADVSPRKAGGEERASDESRRETPARDTTSDAGRGKGTSGLTAAGGSEGRTRGGAGGDPAALNSQGFGLMNEGRYEDAIPLLRKAVAAYRGGSEDLTYAYALYNLGRSLRLAGRPKEAVPILEKRLRIPNQTATVRRELDAARRAAG